MLSFFPRDILELRVSIKVLYANVKQSEIVNMEEKAKANEKNSETDFDV